MKVAVLRNELTVIGLLTLVLIAATNLSTPNVARIVLGVPFLVFFPGYTLTLALFPQKEQIGSVTRIGLIFGTSIAVVGLIGLTLSYTLWGITLESTLYAVATFIFVTLAIAWFRQRRLPKHERFCVGFNFSALSRQGTMWGRVSTIMLVISIVGAVGILGYTLTNPKVGESFTEFYILGKSGKATYYPRELDVGQQGTVIVSITNYEREEISYRIEITIDDVKSNEIGPVTLDHNESWEEVVTFTPSRAGNNQKVEFLLYKEGGEEPYR